MVSQNRAKRLIIIIAHIMDVPSSFAAALPSSNVHAPALQRGAFDQSCTAVSHQGLDTANRTNKCSAGQMAPHLARRLLDGLDDSTAARIMIWMQCERRTKIAAGLNDLHSTFMLALIAFAHRMKQHDELRRSEFSKL